MWCSSCNGQNASYIVIEALVTLTASDPVVAGECNSEVLIVSFTDNPCADDVVIVVTPVTLSQGRLKCCVEHRKLYQL